jgi:subtilisin-like proprotein convertase family protein
MVSWLAISILLTVASWLITLQPGQTAAAPETSPLLAEGRQPESNRIQTENALPGTDEWAAIGNYDINSLQAFAGAASVDAGNPIVIHVKSTGSSLSARLYRMGYYQDHGALIYATFSGIPTPAQPNCTLDNSTGLVSCPWSSTFTINTDPGWISGFYLLRLDSNNGFRTFVYFILRNDGYASDILVMEPTKTNQAYNRYGGESLYYKDPSHGGSRTRAYKVSFDRPYQGGAGTGTLFAHDVEMVRWLEASGYDVSYISDVDRVVNPTLMLNHRVFMVEGHDEYWTWGERDAMEAARDAGVNLIFASANESYWRVRMEDSPIGTNRIITCYKDAALDPSPDKTVTFRDLGRPENSLVGTGYQSFFDETLYGYPWVAYAPAASWYFDCTGFQPGDRVNNIVGEEWDALLNNGFTPPGIAVMARGNMSNPRGEPLLHESTLYTAQSGAQVFAAGSIFFSWGLIDHSYPNQVFQPAYQSNAADPRIEQMMANIIDRFAGYWDGQPRGCSGQSFYKIGPRPTRTAMPQVPTATGTPAGPTPTFTRTPVQSATATATRTTSVASSTPTPDPACSVTYPSSDIPRPVPDQGVITSTLTINDAGTIADIKVTNLAIQHTYASDLTAYIISPQGTRVALFSHVCGGSVWTAANTGFSVARQAASRLGTICPPGQGEYLPEEESLDPLVGQLANGIWSLEVSDDGPSDVGTILSWSLWVSYSAPCPIGTPAPSSTATLTRTPTNTPTNTASATRTATPTGTFTVAPTATRTPTITPTPTPTFTSTASRTPTTLPSATNTATSTLVATSTPTSTGTFTVTPSVTPAATGTSTPTSTATVAPSATRTPTLTTAPASSATSTATFTPTGTFTSTATSTPTGTAAPSSTSIPTATATQVSATTATYTATPSPTDTITSTSTATPTNTAISTSTPLPTGTATATGTTTTSVTATGTATLIPPPTVTDTPVPIPPSPTLTAANTVTRTPTPTLTTTPTRTPSSTRTSTPAPPSRTTTATSTAISTPACSMTYTSLNVPRAIPDQGTAASTLAITVTGTIADIRVVNLTIDHTYASDLSVYLTSPQGTRVALFTHVCGSGVWTAANTGFTISRGASAVMGTTCPPRQGTYLPEEGSLSPLLGQQANGVWRLEVTDGGPYDVGTLRAWGLWIAYSGPVCPLGSQWQATATAAVPSPTSSPTRLAVSFADVLPGSTFYPYVQWMASNGFVRGYDCGAPGEPCPGQYFRPGANVTRGQLLKMAVNAAAWGLLNPKEPTFADVPRESTFYLYVETAYANGIINGYPCGGPGELCDPSSRPYFRPGNNITRGQLSKVIALVQGYSLPSPALPTFADVPASQTFFAYIEAVYAHGIINGYPCGSPGEPCDSGNRPYFRPAKSATRGQVSKLVTISSGGP